MNVLMINGSPRINGNTTIALNEMKKIFDDHTIESTIIQIGNQDIRGCIACNQCKQSGHCVFDDAVNQIAPLLEKADGFVVGSPVYYAGANGTLISFLNRLFYSTRYSKAMKVAASVVVARRGGCSSTFDGLNKVFADNNMVIATSCYWNSVHGHDQGEAFEDAEGLQTMRILATNMVFLMKSIALGKQEYGFPEYEPLIKTNFIR